LHLSNTCNPHGRWFLWQPQHPLLCYGDWLIWYLGIVCFQFPAMAPHMPWLPAVPAFYGIIVVLPFMGRFLGVVVIQLVSCLLI
jgi:hypothetical protein